MPEEIKRTKGPATAGLMSIRDFGFEKPELAGLQEFNISLQREATKMEMILTSMRQMAIDYGAEIVESLGQAFGGGNLKEIGKSLLLSLANFLSQFGKLLIMAGIGMEAFIKSTATMNPILAITAGTAMLIAAGLIRGALSGAGKSVASGAGGGGGYAGSSMQNIKVIVEGKISGKDIVIASRRYMEGNG